MRKFFTLFVMFFAFTIVASAEEPRLPEGTRLVSVAEVGKSGSGVSFVSEVEVAQLMKRPRLISTGITPIPITQEKGALVRDDRNKFLAFIGPLNSGSVVVPVLRYPRTNRRRTLDSFRVDETSRWFIPVWNGEIPLSLALQEFPEMEVRVFDPSTGELQMFSAMLNEYPPNFGGIGDVYKDKNIVVTGRFDSGSRVRVNYTEIPENMLIRRSERIEVGLYNSLDGGSVIWQGNNLITVTTENGESDTYLYRYNPQSGVTTVPQPSKP